MHCYKMLISYDGTNYSGWQIQPNALSIQQTLQDALKILLKGESPSVIGSGRTDAGVHAIGQIAHFKVNNPIPLFRIHAGLNGILPHDIRVKQIEEVSLNFHSQYDAIGKEYHYHIFLGRILEPFYRLYRWHVWHSLDLDLLTEAATLFVGKHDFTSFANHATKGSAARNPVRTLYRLNVFKEGNEMRLEFEGDGFLYQMIRNIVGTLIEIASHRVTLQDVEKLFLRRDRRLAGQAAPAKGLFLVKVNYKNS